MQCDGAGLHNSKSSKGQIDQHKLAAGRKSLFRHSVEEILKGQVIIQSRAFATFSATEFSQAARKDLAGRMWPVGRMLCRPAMEFLKSCPKRYYVSCPVTSLTREKPLVSLEMGPLP